MTQKKVKKNFAFPVLHERYKSFEAIIFKKKEGNYIQQPIDIGVCGVNLRPPISRILLNYFLRVDGEPKALENTWKFVVFIVLYLILRFARSSAYHHAHTIDIYGYLYYGYFGCKCSIVEKSPREGSKTGGYALELNVLLFM